MHCGGDIPNSIKFEIIMGLGETDIEWKQKPEVENERAVTSNNAYRTRCIIDLLL